MALDGIADLQGVAPAVPNARGAALPREAKPAADERGDAASHTTMRELSAQMEKLTRALQASQSSLSFSVDENTGKTIVRVVSSTGELVRQIPSEEALAIAATLAPGDSLKSLGLDRWS